MFVEGYEQTKEHQEAAKESRRKMGGEFTCQICGKVGKRYSANQQTCGSKECQDKNSIRKYHELKTTDPIKWKAKAISGSIRLGKNKTEIIVEMLKNALGKKCEYCDEIITLDNAGLDHKEPRYHKKVYNPKTKERIYTDSELRELDRVGNLHIVCRRCNNIKGDMSDLEFIAIMELWSRFPGLREKIVKRFNIANLRYGK